MQYFQPPTEDIVAPILPEHRSRRFNNAAMQSFLLETCLSPHQAQNPDGCYTLAFRRDATVLEIGCGIGNTLFDITEQFGTHSVGIDLNAGSNLPDPQQGSLNFANEDICHLPAHYHNKFDLAFSYYTWHYLGDKLGALRNVHLALKPGGKAIIDFGSFLVRDTDGEPELYDPLISPDLQTLLTCSEHDGQLSTDIRRIFDVRGAQERRCCRVHITKTSEAPIRFPFFEGVLRNQPGNGMNKAFKTSSYRTDLQDPVAVPAINGNTLRV